MQMYLISDNHDTLTGMRLCGIDGKVVSGAEELSRELSRVVEDTDIAVLLITEKLCAMAPEQVEKIKDTRTTPLLVEIPDRHGSSKPSDFITRYVKEAVGIRM